MAVIEAEVSMFYDLYLSYKSITKGAKSHSIPKWNAIQKLGEMSIVKKDEVRL